MGGGGGNWQIYRISHELPVADLRNNPTPLRRSPLITNSNLTQEGLG